MNSTSDSVLPVVKEDSFQKLALWRFSPLLQELLQFAGDFRLVVRRREERDVQVYEQWVAEVLDKCDFRKAFGSGRNPQAALDNLMKNLDDEKFS